MHIATHNWMRPESIKRTIERMRETGVDALEISGEPDQYDVKEVRKLLADNGRTCWGSVTLTLGERNLAAKSVAQREKTVDYMKRVVTLSKELGGQMITMVPATVGKVVADGTPSEEWKWLVEGIKEVYAHAEKAGIRIAIEPLNRFETYFLNTQADAAKLVRAIGVKGVGEMYDTFHANIEEKSPRAGVQAMAGHFAHVHISECDRGTPGTGMVRWDETFAALREVKYDGWLVIEAFGRALPALAAATKVWRDLFPTPEQVYVDGLRFMRTKWKA